MNYPHMTPRRWFWSFMTAALVWSGVGTHWNVAWMDTFQAKVVRQPIEAVLTPAQWLFSFFQQSLHTTLAGKGVADPNARLTDQQILEKLRGLENENARLRGLLHETEAHLIAMRQLQTSGIDPEKVLEATVIGYSASLGSSTLSLDKGATSGVVEGAPVLFAPPSDGILQGVTLLGRVQKVFQVGCEVRLLSDPASKVRAQIVRPSLRPAATAPTAIPDIRITREPYLVYGLGSNEMEMRDLDVQTNNAPQKGDLIQLIDNTFPPKAQYMVIGQIDGVSMREKQKLRYEIHITPRVAITSLHTVMILVK